MTKLLAQPSRQGLYKKLLAATAVAVIIFFIVMPFKDASMYQPIQSDTKVAFPRFVDFASRLTGYKYSNKVPVVKPRLGKEKACMLTLARNQEIYDMAQSVKNIEDRFNHNFNYDWVFVNDVEFSDEFKNTMTRLVSGTARYGIIPSDMWSYPEWIDQDLAAECRHNMTEDGVIYGFSESYRHMCRFKSMFMYDLPVMDDYDWYLFIEPGTKTMCDVDYDLFTYMRENDKVYGFTTSIHEYAATIPTLWNTTKDFMALHPEHVNKNNLMNFISDNSGETYNMCHFWSNFELGSLKFFRSKAYRDYFNYLDQAGGFFYERWGDAPVHSLAVSLFVNKRQVFHLEDFSYYHGPFMSCPLDPAVHEGGKCECDPDNDFTFRGYSCTNKFYDVQRMKKPKDFKLFTAR